MTGDPAYTADEEEYLAALLAERARVAPRWLTECDRLHVLRRLGWTPPGPGRR